MKDKVHIGKDEQVQLQQIYHRLNAVGIDIKDPRHVILALDSEIQHYRSVIDAIGNHTPKPNSLVYDYEVALEDNLGRILTECNAHGYEIVSVTQRGPRFTVIFRRPADG